MIQTSNEHFDSIEAFSEAGRSTGWNMNFKQLNAASEGYEISSATSSSAVLTKVFLGSSVEQQASFPRGYRSFGILQDARSQGTLGRRLMSDDALICFHEVQGLHCISRPEFTGFTLSFDNTRLSEIAFNLKLPDPSSKPKMSGSAATPEPAQLTQLRTDLQTIFCQLPIDGTATNQSPHLRSLIDSKLPAAILQAWMGAQPVDYVPRRQRTRALRKALEYVEAHIDDPLTVEDLCRESSTSFSSLGRAFSETFNITPQRYLTVVRLNRAQRALIDPSNTKKISAIANDAGFWHLGKFAQDYRGLFGLLPSHSRQKIAKITNC